MKIYTKTGDNGDTSLFGGKRVPKSTLRIDVYGTVDELNALLGSACSFTPSPVLDDILHQVQNQLFVLGADLATPEDVISEKIQRISDDDILFLEKTMDELEPQLSPLKSFILPGGSRLAAQLHVARSVCRRAERLMDGLIRKENCVTRPLVFLNRLSDLLFILARFANKMEGTEEKKWLGANDK